MRKFIFIIVALFFTLSISCVNRDTQMKNSEIISSFDDDQKAIQSVIALETAAYFDRDIKTLIDFYAGDEITQSAWNNPNGTFGLHKGINEIEQNFATAFKNNPDRLNQPKIDRTDWYFKKLSEDWMWVNFTQKTKGIDGALYTNYETRLMKKVNHEWKIAVMYALADHGKSEEN